MCWFQNGFLIQDTGWKKQVRVLRAEAARKHLHFGGKNVLKMGADIPLIKQRTLSLFLGIQRSDEDRICVAALAIQKFEHEITPGNKVQI